MRYLIEPKCTIYVKGYRFLYFAKNMGKNLSNKHSQKFLDTAKKSTTNAIKTASKRVIQETAEVTGDYKIADKITGVSTELHSKYPTLSKNDDANSETEVSKKRYISPEERQQIIDQLRPV